MLIIHNSLVSSSWQERTWAHTRSIVTNVLHKLLWRLISPRWSRWGANDEGWQSPKYPITKLPVCNLIFNPQFICKKSVWTGTGPELNCIIYFARSRPNLTNYRCQNSLKARCEQSLNITRAWSVLSTTHLTSVNEGSNPDNVISVCMVKTCGCLQGWYWLH